MLESDWGIVSFYNNPRDFFVQLERDLGTIEQVSASVDKYVSRFSKVNKSSKFYANDFVVAKWNEDDGWYRAVIDEVYESSGTYKVTFIDFGNSVTVSSKDILSQSTEELFETSAIAHRCCYFARDRTKMSDWEPLLNQFRDEVGDDSRKFYIEAVGFSVSHHEVKLYTSKENKDKKLDLLGELKHVKVEISNTSIATSEYARGTPVSKSELGMVVYVKNVDEFYVQLNRDEAALNTAYTELAGVQSRLSNKNGGVTHMPPNSPCIVLHSEDSCLYRGQIVRQSSDTITVKLVDFGEVMEVSSSHLYPAIDSLLKYPAFGLHCRVNVESSSRKEVVFNVLQNLMESSSPVKINFVSDCAPYTVILTATGSSQVLAGDEESLTTSAINTTYDSLPDRPAMAPGSRFVGILVYESVEEDSMMFLQTKSDEKESEKVQALLEENDLLTLKGNLIKEGQICIAPYEEVMYRAVIKKVDNHSKEVFFTDFGNTESLASGVEVFKMPTELKSIPPLCMKCKLVGYQSFSDLPLDESEVVMPTEFEVVSRTDDVWILRHLDGKKPPEIVRYPFTKQTVGTNFVVSFSHVSSKFGELSFCQLESAGDDLDIITSAIDSNESSLKPLPISHAQVGSACIAVHDEDEELYRAEIISLSGSTAIIRFVDFGNSKTSNISDLKEPPSSVTSLPSLAIPVLLTASQLSQVEPDAVQYDVKLISGDDVNGWRVNIPEIDASESANASGTVKEIEAGSTIEKYVDLDMASGKHLIGYFTYIAEEHSASYFQTVKMGEQLEVITASIEGLGDELDNLSTHHLVEGRPCLAQDVDEVFYRGKISKLSDGNADVLFVDYGTSRTLPSMELRQIPPNLLQTPVCAIPVNLTSDQITTIDLDREDYDLEILDGDTYGGIRVAIGGALAQKSLVSNAGDRLCVDSTTVDSYEKHSFSIGKKISGYFAFVSEKEGVLSHFQTLEMSDTLNDVSLQIEEVNDWEDLSPLKLKVGQACIASDVDDVFYRATITQILESDVGILFVDYGTSRTVSLTMLKAVPCGILSVPVCLVPLLLTKTQMSDIDLDREDYEIEVIKGDENSGYRVLIDGIVPVDFPSEGTSNMNKGDENDANGKLDAQTIIQRYANSTHEKNQSLNGFFVFVSDKTGGLSYFQTHEMLDSATSIGERISEIVEGSESLAGQVVVGQACLAQDVDEVFYRAEVTEKQEDEYKVVFVDYGTSREVPTSLMKKIPEEMVSTPVNIVPLILTPEQQESVDMDREDYTVTLRGGSEADGWLVSMEGSDNSSPGGDVESEKDTMATESVSETKTATSPVEYQRGSFAIGDKVIGFFTYLSQKEGSRCYFQTHDQLEKATTIGEELIDLAESSESLAGHEVVVGQACLAQDVDEVFYRAEVTEKQGDEYKVVFVDYGTSREVPTSLMKKIPEEMVSTPVNIIPLVLTPEQQESVDMDREDYTVTLRGGSEADGWIVTLDELECQNELTNEIDETSPSKLDAKANDEIPFVEPYSSLSYVPSAYKHGDSITGFFTYVSHSDGCVSYFQTHEMLESATSVSEQLLSCVDSSEILAEEDVLVGTPCLAQDVDEKFYRAKVMELLDHAYKVLFVDYGTIGTVDVSLMKKAPEKLLKIPINVMPFMLTPSQMESIDMNREDYCIELSSGDEANGWNINFEEPNDTSVAVVTVSIDSDPNNDKSSALEGCSTTSSPLSLNKKLTVARNALGYARAKNSIGDKFTGYFTFLSHNEDFISYFQTEEMCDKASAIGERICEILADSYDIPAHEVAVGVPCLGQDDDGVFYRSVVTKKIDEQAEVLFVDYGSFNTPTVPLKRIPDDLLSIPISVCPFMLTSDVMETLDVNSVYTVKLVDGNEDSGWQASFVGNASTEEIPQEQAGIGGYPERKENIGDVRRCMALIVSTSTNDLSYIQVQSEETTNTKIDGVLSNCKHVSTLRPDQLVVGQACVAPHEDDGLLYRAIITAIDDDISLRFVDWGNKRIAKADLLQVLPQSIKQIPALAIPVRLTESQIETMDVDHVYQVTFVSGSYEEGWVIDFRIDPEVTVETSVTSTSSKSPVCQDSSPSSDVPDRYPCREEVSTNFVKSSADQRNFHGALRVSGIIISRPVRDVGEAIDATEVVYFRSTADEKQLDDINERLESITFNDSVGWRLRQLPTSVCVPDSACLMHDVEKKKWYRGRILATDLPETVAVQLVDHGNRPLPKVPIDRLYRLPKWLRGVVPLCLACHPRDTDSWEVVRSNHHVLMRLVGVDSSTGVVTASFSPHVPYDREQLMQIKDRVLLSDSVGAQSVIRQSMPSTESLDPTHGTVEANVIDVTEQGFLQISLVAEYLNTKKFCDKVDSIYQLVSECLVPVSKPIINGAYVCRNADGHFVRVRVVAFSPDDNTCALHFLDNGHTKTLSNVRYYYLFPHLCHEEPRAWLCDAFDVESITSLSQGERNLIRTILSNHTLQMRIKSDDSLDPTSDESHWWRPFKVSFPEECLTEVTSEGLKQVAAIITSGPDGSVQENGNHDLARIPTQRISPSQQIEVRVTCVDSPHSFWCRDVQSQKSIEKIQGSLLASLGAASSPLDTGDDTVNIVIGGHYALMSSWGWRRALIIDIPGDNVIVQCVDDGQRVETNRKYLRRLPNPGAASQIPCLAMHCSLYGVLPPDGSVWKKEECDEFKMHAMEGSWIATVERIVPTSRGHDLESLFCVSLARSDNGISLTQNLLQEQMLIPDGLNRSMSVSSCGSMSNDAVEECRDGEEVSCFVDGVHEKMILPPKISLPSEAEVIITRVHSCKDFSVCQVHDVLSFRLDMKALKELPPKIEVDVNSSENRLIWCSVIRANQLCRVLMRLPSDNDIHIQFEFVDEGTVDLVQMDSFLGGLHEMPSRDWLHKPRSAVRCSLYNSSGQDATPLRNRMRDKRELSAFVNKVENGLHVVALLDRVDGVDVDVISSYASR